MAHSRPTAKITTLIAALALLSSCGYYQHRDAQSAYVSRMEADADACRKGSQPGCEAYRIDVQRCGMFTNDPVCRANP